MRRFLAVALLALLLSISTIIAAPYDEMDYGPFLSHTFQLPNGNVTLRGIAIPFDAPIAGEAIPVQPPPTKGKPKAPPVNPAKCGVVFDTELLRYSGFWNGGFVTWTGVVFNGAHGANPAPAGKLLSETKMTAGWANAADKLVDPRSYPHGPMAREIGRYKGLYRTDKGIIFSYTVGESNVLDMPNVEVHDKQRLFVRTLNLSPSKHTRFMVIADVANAKQLVSDGKVLMLEDGQNAVVSKVIGGPKGVEIHPDSAFLKNLTINDIVSPRMILKIPASAEPIQLRVGVWGGPKADWRKGADALYKLDKATDLTPLTKGGKARFTETVSTKGVRGDDKTAYTVDSLTPPFKNPYKSWMRFGGIDFFSDGRAAISTWSGDVWIVSGIDDKLENLTWKRYAAGVFHALGLKIVDDKVYVLGRDQITRLHDTNGDGEADFYECFNNDAMITTNFHEFTFDLQTDPEGNFFFIKGGPVRPGGRGWDKVTPHHGCIFKVSSDGSKLEVVARGFRAPNGMGVGPHGEITTGDNEGTWTPACPINWIKPGGFYGVPDFVPSKEKPKMRENPLCWLPRDIDNSNGGQVWITGKNFGPLSGQLLHTSYGTCKLFNVLKEEVAGQMQGGVVPIPLTLDAKGNPKYAFDSGVSRLRFNDKANALFITGLRGWQTTAQKDAGFYRVRYTGKKANLPIDLKVRTGAVSITFSDPLDKASASDADNFNVEEWNYRWTENYGSAQYKVSDAKKQGHDTMEVEAAALSADGKTITLSIAKVQPVMQMKIQFNLKAADGSPVRSAIHNTINVVGNQSGEVHVGEYRIVETKK